MTGMRTVIVAAALGTAAPAAAGPATDWPVVAQGRDGPCRLQVTGNGKIFLIAAEGLGAGGRARFRLANGAMVPIDWAVQAGADGRFARFHMPFRFGQNGGRVDVSLDAPGCSAAASFDWRREIRVIG